MAEQPRYCKRNREKCLEKGGRYYEESRVLWQQKLAHDQSRESFKGGKDRKREYARNRYWNMSEEDRQKLRKRNKNNNKNSWYVPKRITRNSRTTKSRHDRTPEKIKKLIGLVNSKIN